MGIQVRSAVRVALGVVLVLLLVAYPARATTVLGNVSQWDGNYTLGNLDAGEVLGQVFKAPSYVGALSQLSFWMSPYPFNSDGSFNFGPFDLEVFAYLMHWDGQKADGGFLRYQFHVQHFETPPFQPQRVDFSLVPIDLVAGERYVAFLRMVSPQSPGYATLGFINHDTYPDGGFRGPYAGSFFNLTNRAWSGSADDLAFEFTFQSVPEPGTFALLTLGLIPFAAICRRKNADKVARDGSQPIDICR